MFNCKKMNLQMYSIAKIHYTTITMNKEIAAVLLKKLKKTLLLNDIMMVICKY